MNAAEQSIEHFKSIMAENIKWFEFMDPPCDAALIDHFEQESGLRLPEEYSTFVREVGSGQFGLLDIRLPMSLPDYTDELGLISYQQQRFFPMADDHCGGYYGAIARDDRLSKRVFYVYPSEDNGLKMTSENFYDFVVHVGLKGLS